MDYSCKLQTYVKCNDGFCKVSIYYIHLDLLETWGRLQFYPT